MLLEQILLTVPYPIFWKDLNCCFLGCNQAFLEMSELADYEDIKGKTDSDLPWKDYAKDYNDGDRHVMTTGEKIKIIESIPFHNKIMISETIKSPLVQDGRIIGVLGICLDITDRKEAERLKLENEQHILKQLEDQKRFITLAEQVAHDIRSPVTSLLMITKACEAIPEKERVALREAASRVQDIANHLLSRYRADKKTADFNSESLPHQEQEAMLVSAMLLEIITEKRYQYKDLPIKFETTFTPDGYFAFIKTDVSAFKRMISNLINNAVDAFEGNPGKIGLTLHADHSQVGIMIFDNGKGMPPATVAKIMQNIALTEGKKDGHGLGLCQVRETLAKNGGKLNIFSKLGEGTTVDLMFTAIPAPQWIAEKIMLHPQDHIIILDDDGSIHTAWDTRFNSIKQASPQIKINHFEQGSEALAFIQQFSDAQKDRIVLLSDYELLNQPVNGLEIIKAAGVRRAILVTSHYANASVRKEAEALDIKILPKEMASEINIEVQPDAQADHEKSTSQKVDMVIVDDDDLLGEVLKEYFSQHKNVVLYNSANQFLKDLALYPKDTQISLDNNFKAEGISGLAMAKDLHQLGYTNLYLLSGKEFAPHEIPSYLTFIIKGERNMLKRLGG